MIDYFRGHLGAKLLLSYLAIIVVGMIVLVVASQSILPTSFNRHMAGMGMGFTPGPGVGGGIPGMMGGQGFGRPDGTAPLYMDYRAGFNEALTYAGLAAAAAALALSLFFSRSVVAPVRAMSRATERIAAGRYDERLQARGSDELAQLAGRFNQMAERLDQVESMRRKLIGDVSHELRTPLTAIKGSMEGLIDGVLPASSETYHQISAEADRLNRLVDDLQELSRVEARAFELDIQPIGVPALVGSVVKRLAAQAALKRISVELQLASGLPFVLADEDRAAQVLINLVGNALQYSPEGGKVTIHASQVDREVQIGVHDTGIGIASEHLPYLFDRFYRVDKSRSRQTGGGSGIGLTIARAIVEAHGGRIWVDSDGQGKGSTFTFTLPTAN
jgi:two-component system sensor histidine kinase BaeS